MYNICCILNNKLLKNLMFNLGIRKIYNLHKTLKFDPRLEFLKKHQMKIKNKSRKTQN